MEHAQYVHVRGLCELLRGGFNMACVRAPLHSLLLRLLAIVLLAPKHATFEDRSSSRATERRRLMEGRSASSLGSPFLLCVCVCVGGGGECCCRSFSTFGCSCHVRKTNCAGNVEAPGYDRTGPLRFCKRTYHKTCEPTNQKNVAWQGFGTNTSK